MTQPIRILFTCSGIGIMNRGIESFFREAFDGLKGDPEFDIRLVKGAGDPLPDEWVVPCLKRTGTLAPLIGKLTGRSAYAAEQWSSFLPMVHMIRKFQPQVIFYSDSNLGFLLRRFRKQIGVPFRLLFSNGGPCQPPFNRHDFVHQVAPFYRQTALDAGEPAAKHFMVPYGIHAPDDELPTSAGKMALRIKLGLPPDRPIVLSVGWIARRHKRMHYLIEELSRMPAPRPFLQLLGAMDEQSPEILTLGRKLLGDDGFAAGSVPYAEVADYYRAADVFVLASLQEGFGRVYLESLLHGLPTIAHQHPVMQYVLGDAGILGDLSRQGSLLPLLSFALCSAKDTQLPAQRRAAVIARFGWRALRPEYLAMFRSVACCDRQPGDWS